MPDRDEVCLVTERTERVKPWIDSDELPVGKIPTRPHLLLHELTMPPKLTDGVETGDGDAVPQHNTYCGLPDDIDFCAVTIDTDRTPHQPEHVCDIVFAPHGVDAVAG